IPSSAGTLTNPKAIMPPAISVTAARMASWSQIRRGNRTMSVRSPPIGCDQRIACGVRAWHLTDRATPLHFEFGEVAFPPRPGEQAGVQSAQRQVDDERDVREVTAEPVRHGALHP